LAASILEILDPTAEPRPEAVLIAVRVADLEGNTLGLLDNGKPNADLFLARMEEGLAHRYGLDGVLRRQKPHVAGPAPEVLIEELVAGCHSVINALGD
jgi:hypothetical protein